MNLLLFLPGFLLMMLVMYDLIYTTMAPSGAGMLTNRVTSVVLRVFFLLKKLLGKRQALGGAGVVIMCTTLLTWFVIIWLANILIFSSDAKAVLNDLTREAATFQERIYFSGYLLSTMGNGDFVGGSPGWKIYSAVVSFTGLIFITLGITYIGPIISSISERRSLSLQIAALGHSPQSILLNHWNGENFKQLELGLMQLSVQIAQQGQLHLSYPVLHYFDSQSKRTALLPNLAALDEALSILYVHVEPELWPRVEYLKNIRSAISSFLDTISYTFEKPSEEEAAPLLIDELKQKTGLCLHEPEDSIYEKLQHRRRLLKAMVQNDGWDWDELYKKEVNCKIDIEDIFS